MRTFEPDYRNIVQVARNKKPNRLPLYEHYIDTSKMEDVLGYKFNELSQGSASDKKKYFKSYCDFFKKMGYDSVSFECCVGDIMPGSGALGRHVDPVIKTMEDFNNYCWEEIEEIYFNTYGERFKALREVMPEGMKAIGGVGNGVFECVQELVGYTNLCYLKYDDEELYAKLFVQVGQVLENIWARFLKEYGDIYCIARFGDDLGFVSNTLLPVDDVREHILPVYKRIVSRVHAYDKPFLLHSCGNIFEIMPDLITDVGIDAKHSNEDNIAQFTKWMALYGDAIGNFGGIDLDYLCRGTQSEIEDEVKRILDQCHAIGKGGFAFSTGNSIPDYVSTQNYVYMVEAVRRYRGE